MTGQCLTLPPLGLYIHIPWCLRKCPYCDFNSHAATGNLPENDYVAALLMDFEQDLPFIQHREISSIFIGGGTPSLFSAGALGNLLDGLAQTATLAADIEITLEANPGTFEMDRFRDFRATGINRLSLGIQSFDAASLGALGRVHGTEEAQTAAGKARAAGFDNFNLDLMFGLPGQDMAAAMADLDTALSFAPPHLSWYQLTIEPNTVFYSKPPLLPDDDGIAAMQDAGIALLSAHGLARYEISAYSAPGRQARHNLNYWQFGDYLGIGAGAHGKITRADGSILRTRKTRQPSSYLAGNGNYLAERAVVENTELPLEFMMNALRLCAGVDNALYAERTGLALADITPALDRLRRRGLLEHDRLAATPQGLAFLNDVLAAFLAEHPATPNRIPAHSH